MIATNKTPTQAEVATFNGDLYANGAISVPAAAKDTAVLERGYLLSGTIGLGVGGLLMRVAAVTGLQLAEHAVIPGLGSTPEGMHCAMVTRGPGSHMALLAVCASKEAPEMYRSAQPGTVQLMLDGLGSQGKALEDVVLDGRIPGEPTSAVGRGDFMVLDGASLARGVLNFAAYTQDIGAAHQVARVCGEQGLALSGQNLAVYLGVAAGLLQDVTTATGVQS